MFLLPSRAFPGGDNEYNRLVDEELDSIENALDTICDDVDNLDYNIAVKSKLDGIMNRVVFFLLTWDRKVLMSLINNLLINKYGGLLQ